MAPAQNMPLHIKPTIPAASTSAGFFDEMILEKIMRSKKATDPTTRPRVMAMAG